MGHLSEHKSEIIEVVIELFEKMLGRVCLQFFWKTNYGVSVVETGAAK